MSIFIPENIVPPSPDSQNNSWVSEAIWGHRIQPQDCQLLLLEFLSMAEGMSRQGKLLDPVFDRSGFSPYLSTQLRNILFKNPRINEIHEEHGDAEIAWDQWFESMCGAIAATEALKDFSYLKKRFGSFGEFVSLINLLTRITIPKIGEKQWNFRRIYPIGPAAYYDERNKEYNRTRVQFTRTGELAYLMLARAKINQAEIREWLEEAFRPDAPKNRLLCSLMKDSTPDLATVKDGTYLPYREHPAFDNLAQDVHALFRLGMPAPDTFQNLAPLLAFHLFLYQLQTANLLLGKTGMPTIVCEILALRMNQVRKASIESLGSNDGLALRALERFVQLKEESSGEIAELLAEEDPLETSTIEAYREMIKNLYSIREAPAGISIKDIRNNALSSLKKDYEESAGGGLRSMADQAGLRSRVKSRQHRYCPSDQFLRNLVYVNVTAPLKETSFLAKLFDRYGLVIGEQEAAIEGSLPREGLFQKNEFEHNTERLISRLAAMGLARRMSDSFTYIVNPIFASHDT